MDAGVAQLKRVGMIENVIGLLDVIYAGVEVGGGVSPLPASASSISAIFRLNNSFSVANIFWIAPPVPRRQVGASDQRVPRLDVRVHYAGGVERVQRYQEVAEEAPHLQLRQVIVLLLSNVVIVVLLPAGGTIVVVPADGRGAARWRRVAVAPLPLMMASAVAEPLRFGTGVLEHQRVQLPRLPSLLNKLPRVVIPPPSSPPPEFVTCKNIIGIVVAGAAVYPVHRVWQDDADQMGEVWQPLPRAVGEHEQLPA
jgi:hypothetical protein